jgi:hypothetical protein
VLHPADAQQKGFYSRSIRKLESLLDKGSGGGSLALEHDIATRLNAQQKQLLHLNRALLYLLSGARHGAISICSTAQQQDPLKLESVICSGMPAHSAGLLYSAGRLAAC